MSIVNSIVDWTKVLFLPLGPFGLFILAFVEAVFFPIPPDLLLIILVLANPSHALWFATICTVGSVLGGMFGYTLGYTFGRPVLDKLFKETTIQKVHTLFQKYEWWAIFIAGFTPIPYKVFTIAAGVFYINFKKFVAASVLSRGLRFFIIATFLILFGEIVVSFIEQYFELFTISVVIVILIGYYLIKKIKKKGQIDLTF